MFDMPSNQYRRYCKVIVSISSIEKPCQLLVKSSPQRATLQVVRIPAKIRKTRSPEKVADALLEAVGAFSEENGIYTDAQLTRKMRLERNRLPEIEECGLPEEVTAELVERRIDELISLSGMCVSQEAVFRLHLCGLSLKQIANSLKISPHKVEFRLRIAKRRIRSAYKECKYAGWYEVYLSEVHRPIYRRPKHKTQHTFNTTTRIRRLVEL